MAEGKGTELRALLAEQTTWKYMGEPDQPWDVKEIERRVAICQRIDQLEAELAAERALWAPEPPGLVMRLLDKSVDERVMDASAKAGQGFGLWLRRLFKKT